ncbi:hypothetical protein LTR50_004835 [Elasticomyces elasticus]|nr:hypothetical protein LTR50_004835 [Elasticomyces elasticus]
MATVAISRYLLPRGSLSRQDKHLQARLKALSVRHASSSSTASVKPRVLEKPTRFNPPSHSSRRTKPRAYPGPPLSDHAREEMKKKRYPHMMPPEGTFMHWFLTDRSIHVWISLSTLISLAFFTFVTNFTNNTPYKDMLPPGSLIFSHPFQFVGKYIEVYRMHVSYVSAQTAEKRRRKVEDVQKRAEYRKAHGLDQDGLFGWTAKTNEESIGPALREEGTVTSEDEAFKDFEGKRRPVRKWLGIW